MKSFQFLIFFITLASFAHSFNICSRSPKWTLSNKKFPNSFANSHIKVLAFLKASCGFCQTQLARLVELQNEFNLEKKISVSIIVINSFDQESFQLRQVFQDINKNKTLTLVQDTNLFNIWDLYTVITDDMLVFDRCNRMVAHLSLPDSVVTNGKLKNEILSAYSDSICSTSTCKKKPLSHQ